MPTPTPTPVASVVANHQEHSHQEHSTPYRPLFRTVLLVAVLLVAGLLVFGFIVHKKEAELHTVLHDGGYAIENDIYCSKFPVDCSIPEPDTIAVPICTPVPVDGAAPVRAREAYNAPTAQALLRMIRHVYLGKEPFPFAAAGDTPAAEWMPLAVPSNTVPYGWAGLYQGTIYVIFRGTDSANEAEWDVDLEITQTEFRATGIYCHAGYVAEAHKFLPAVEALMQANPAAPVVTAGHSMGGGYCLLTALLATDLNPAAVVLCYAFGSPRVCDCGGDDLARYSADFPNFHYFNVQNVLDPIPKAPPAVTPDLLKTDSDGNPVLYLYCEYGQQATFQDNRSALTANHALATYFHNATLAQE